MFISAATGAVASTLAAELTTEPTAEPTAAPVTTPATAPSPSATSPSINMPRPSVPQPEHIRHLLFGTPSTVQVTIRHLHRLGYAEPNDWSRPISTGRANEVMAILTKRVGIG